MSFDETEPPLNLLDAPENASVPSHTRPLDLAVDSLRTWEVWSGDTLSTSQENAVSLLVIVFSLYF